MPLKQLCRLCCYETTDTIEIFSEKGLELDYKTKINKYLYLKVFEEDEYPKTVCWMCSQHLETFHRFFEKINEIQQANLKDDYENFILKPIYHDDEDVTKLLHSKLEENAPQIIEISDYKIDPYAQEQQIIDTVDDTTNVVEVLVLDSLQNDDQEESLLSDNDDDDTDQHQIVIEKTNNEINENDDVETYVIYEKHNNMSDNFSIQDDQDIEQETNVINENDPMQTNNDNEILYTAEQETDTDEIIPIPISDHDESFEDNTEIDVQQKKTANKRTIKGERKLTTRKRCGRKSSKTSKLDEQDESKLDIVKIKTEPKESKFPKIKKERSALMREKHRDIPMHELKEGESDDEFPARDEDNDDWPAQQTLDEFPDVIIDDNGQLMVKGKKLMTLICKFYKLNCELCNDATNDTKLRFRLLNDLFVHYTEEHKVEGYIMCCQTKLIRYPTIVMHMARHLQPDAFRCNVCGYMVTRPRFLESHRQTHLPEEEKPYACDKCPRRFCWKGALQIHMISHQPAHERKQYICHLCGKVYDTPGGLSTHKKMIHTDKDKKNQTAQSNICHLCAKTFATRTNLQEHMSTIHQPRENDQLQCVECGKWLMNQRCLKSHMILHSDVELRCDICDYVTKKQHLLKKHLLTQHSDVKPFKCELCTKSYKIKRALTVHIQQHKNAKTYKCPFCARVFNSSTNFYTHRKHMHPNELFALKERKLEIQRQKRILIGREEGRIIDGLNLDEDDLLGISSSSGGGEGGGSGVKNEIRLINDEDECKEEEDGLMVRWKQF